MKVPLKYQSTDYDCAPTTLLNALNYLLDREDIQPELVKTIYAYSLDRFDDQGNTCRGGTSKTAVQLIANWINTFSQTRSCGIRCDFLNCDDIDLSNIRLINHLTNGGVMLACVYYENAVFHYVLVTAIDENYVYLFDPYYTNSLSPDNAFEIINNEPFKANRKVKRQRFNSSNKNYYALGERSKRECVLMEKSR